MSKPRPAEGADVGKFLRDPRPEAETMTRPDESTPRDRVPARVSFVTLAVRDMAEMTRFYRQFRWPESKHSDESFVAFQTGGAVLGLFPAKNYEKELGPGSFVTWSDPPEDIHSQQGIDEPATELVLFGRDVTTIPRRYYDPETGNVRTALPQ